ncbi:melanoma-associated antigen B10-like [Dasypus novemcinctus]|uniref:melanoma-associated antigen B10-like n=1 Tax=Dasypus novemcinctus TaxID=9361 RepID=UPI00265D834C|nr:melanoma-associated antigen B10-like [Dasypus novemcinctus]
MPRGQKSKIRAREKRRQAREEAQVGPQAPAAVAEEAQASCSPGTKDIAESSPPAWPPSPPQGLQRGSSTSTPAAAVPCTGSEEGTNTQEEESAKSAQAQPATAHWLRGPVDMKVAMLVHYLLHKYQMKEPITKGDMLKNIIQTSKSHYPEILKKAAHHLELIFGLDVKEVDTIKHTYVLVNKLEMSCEGKTNEDRGLPKTGLLMTVLGVILTKGNCATEEEVWEVLNLMGVYAERRHFIFGDPKQLLTKDMVQLNYLEYRQVPNSNPPCYEFLWGPRAHAETTKMKVLEFLAKIHNTIPSAFPLLYEEAMRDEEERAQARAAARAHMSTTASARARAIPGSSCPKQISQAVKEDPVANVRKASVMKKGFTRSTSSCQMARLILEGVGRILMRSSKFLAESRSLQFLLQKGGIAARGGSFRLCREVRGSPFVKSEETPYPRERVRPAAINPSGLGAGREAWDVAPLRFPALGHQGEEGTGSGCGARGGSPAPDGGEGEETLSWVSGMGHPNRAAVGRSHAPAGSPGRPQARRVVAGTCRHFRPWRLGEPKALV